MLDTRRDNTTRKRLESGKICTALVITHCARAPRHPYTSSRRFHIIIMRFCTTPRSVIITVAGLFMAATFAEAKPFRRSLLSGDDDDAGCEWSGVFATDANEHTWLMQANSTGQYPDETMKLVIFALDATPTYDNAAATLTSTVNTAVTLMASTCTNLTAGGTITPQSAGGCVNLVTGTTEDSSWTIVTTNVKGLAIFAEHVPIEFERDTHFLRAGTDDIECKAEKSPGGGGHDHGHGDEEEEEEKESCACAAGRLGFSIDCTNQAAITAAITYLSTHGICASCAPSDECKKQFAILQTHHDYCHHEEIPEAAEHEIHDFEAFYEGCTIKRRYDPQLAMCPASVCATAKTDLPTKAQLDAADCDNDCSSATCKSYFQDILWAHDNCEHDEIDQIHEAALHDLEEKCDESGHMCNSAPEAFVRLDYSACPQYSSAGIQRTTAFGMCVAGALLATM